jgi:hypothetical protein
MVVPCADSEGCSSSAARNMMELFQHKIQSGCKKQDGDGSTEKYILDARNRMELCVRRGRAYEVKFMFAEN